MNNTDFRPTLGACAIAPHDSPLAKSRSLGSSSQTTLVGMVVSHDTLSHGDDRVCVEFQFGGAENKRVVAEPAMGVSVVPGDRVLCALPGNSSVAVITAVMKPAHGAGRIASPQNNLVLHEAESLQVKTSSGQTLVAIERGATGPIIRLGEGSLELDMPGELHLLADSLRFTTRRGPIAIESLSDDVVVQGRTIRLN